jgi:hypothetical protein
MCISSNISATISQRFCQKSLVLHIVPRSKVCPSGCPAECTPIANGGGPVTCTNNNDTQGSGGFQCDDGYFFMDTIPADGCKRMWQHPRRPPNNIPSMVNVSSLHHSILPAPMPYQCDMSATQCLCLQGRLFRCARRLRSRCGLGLRCLYTLGNKCWNGTTAACAPEVVEVFASC